MESHGVNAYFTPHNMAHSAVIDTYAFADERLGVAVEPVRFLIT
jgi:hypothetical protein